MGKNYFVIKFLNNFLWNFLFVAFILYKTFIHFILVSLETTTNYFLIIMGITYICFVNICLSTIKILNLTQFIIGLIFGLKKRLPVFWSWNVNLWYNKIWFKWDSVHRRSYRIIHLTRFDDLSCEWAVWLLDIHFRYLWKIKTYIIMAKWADIDVITSSLLPCRSEHQLDWFIENSL